MNMASEVVEKDPKRVNPLDLLSELVSDHRCFLLTEGNSRSARVSCEKYRCADANIE
jgi:hypothetical protein